MPDQVGQIVQSPAKVKDIGEVCALAERRLAAGDAGFAGGLSVVP